MTIGGVQSLDCGDSVLPYFEVWHEEGRAGFVREDERRAAISASRDRTGRRGGIATQSSKVQAECRTADHNISFCACEGLLIDDLLKLCLRERVLEELVEAVDDLLDGECSNCSSCSSCAMVGQGIWVGHWG